MSSSRIERIEKLMYQLRDEIEHGVIAGDINEKLAFDFYIPFSRRIKKGMVYCLFETKPIGTEMMNIDLVEKRMDLVKRGPDE